jgi:GntR family transcriptional regulator / MocR family aminotransferase
VRQESEPVSGPGLPVALERGAGATLHEQLERWLRDQVRAGKLAPGDRLPSSRGLATELGVSRGVVLEAYAQLSAEGYLTASQGAPTRIAATFSLERPPVAAGSLAPHYQHDLQPGIPDLPAFPRSSWLRSLRTVLRESAFDQLGEGDPRGAPELRNELMRYLGRVRSAAPEPEHTLVCAGFTQGFAILCRALRDRGLERVAVEQPGWAQHRLVAERAGLEPVPVEVDDDGLDVERLRLSGCEAVVVTPAHQFPTGGVMASERRAALLEWAEDEDGLIVEDDYDSELRYDRVPVGALQGLAPERVCHIGSASKRLAPGIGLGWLLSPSWLTGALTYEKALADGGTPAVDQLALAEFISRGELDRHLRRMRLRYRRRREVLVQALASAIPGSRVTGVAAGLHVLVELGPGVDEQTILSAAGARGIAAEGLSWHRAGAVGAPGLVLGFANLSEPAIEQGIRVLGEAAAGAAIASRRDA